VGALVAVRVEVVVGVFDDVPVALGAAVDGGVAVSVEVGAATGSVGVWVGLNDGVAVGTEVAVGASVGVVVEVGVAVLVSVGGGAEVSVGVGGSTVGVRGMVGVGEH
jgi:hypothetical protein